jgi:hypothetical protein
MSLADKVGQMLLIGFHGQSVDESPELATMVEEHHIGGIVMLEANAHDPHGPGLTLVWSGCSIPALCIQRVPLVRGDLILRGRECVYLFGRL